MGCRRRPLAAGGGRRGRRPPAGARPQGADQAGRAHLRGRGRLPLRPHPDPRRRLRLDAEAAPRRAARAVRRLGRGPCRRAVPSSTRSSATTSSRPTASGSSSAGRRGRGGARRPSGRPARCEQAGARSPAATLTQRASLLGRAAALRPPTPDARSSTSPRRRSSSALVRRGRATTFGRAIEDGGGGRRRASAVARPARRSALIGFLVRGEMRIEDFAAEVAPRAARRSRRAGDDATVAAAAVAAGRRPTGGAARSCRCRTRSSARSRMPARAGGRRGWRRTSSVRLGFAASSGRCRSTTARRSIARTVEHVHRGHAPRRGCCCCGRRCWRRWPATSTRRVRSRRAGTEILDALGRGVGARRDQRRGRARSSCSPATPARRSGRSGTRSTQLEELGELANLVSVAAQLAETLHAQRPLRGGGEIRRDERARRPPPTTSTRRSPGASRARRPRAGLGAADEARARRARAPSTSPSTTDSPVFAAEALLGSRRRYARGRRGGGGAESPPRRARSSTRRRGTSSPPSASAAASSWRHVQRRRRGDARPRARRAGSAGSSGATPTIGRRLVDDDLVLGRVERDAAAPTSSVSRGAAALGRVVRAADDADLPEHERRRRLDRRTPPRKPRRLVALQPASAGSTPRSANRQSSAEIAGQHRRLEALLARAPTASCDGSDEDAGVAVEGRADALAGAHGLEDRLDHPLVGRAPVRALDVAVAERAWRAVQLLDRVRSRPDPGRGRAPRRRASIAARASA